MRMAVSAALLKSDNRAIWRDALERAAVEVFDALLGIRLEPGVPDDAPLEFTAMVGLAGDLHGVLSVSCSKAVAAGITKRMLQTDHTSEAQIWDVLGEVCNVMAGRFKNGPPRIAGSCALSVPTVITGSNYTQHTLAGSGTLKQYFRMQGDLILIALTVHKAPAS
jgi:chemotaxis protein CheX